MSNAVLHRADCPVVVVRPLWSGTVSRGEPRRARAAWERVGATRRTAIERADVERAGVVVVGVDGSESARSALRFGLEEAARRSARVRVVTAIRSPEYWPVAYGMAPVMVAPPSPEQLAEEAGRTARETVAEVVDDDGRVPVEVRVVQGHPATVLLDQAAGADLLVVGHRGRGAIGSACLGSVGLQCVLRATCPVVVVRSPAGPRTPGVATIAGSEVPA